MKIWDNIDEFEDVYITYFLYREGKSINTIAKIRNISKSEVEKHIIECKVKFNSNFKIQDKDELLKIISMSKDERLEYLKKLDEKQKDILINEIMKRYTKFKNTEDKTILIWLIGELKDHRLMPYLRMELRSNRVNHRRLACSALGKMKEPEGRCWLEGMLRDKNSQVRQYAIKALSYVGNQSTITKLKNVTDNVNEKEYVKRAALEVIEILK